MFAAGYDVTLGENNSSLFPLGLLVPSEARTSARYARTGLVRFEPDRLLVGFVSRSALPGLSERRARVTQNGS